jgi:ribonuclease VapC
MASALTYVDTSAILGILLEEDDARDLAIRLYSASDRVISIVNAVEAVLGMGKNIQDYRRASHIVERFLDAAKIRTIAVEPAIYAIVADAAARYGKGAGGRLNYGDLISYGMTKFLGAPILFKGNDFSRTDLEFA